MFPKNSVERMQNIRFLLILLLGLISVMLYENWQTDYVLNPAVEAAKQAKLLEENGGVPVSTDTGGNVLSAISDRIITVTTDVYRLEIDTHGGTLQNLDLLTYPKHSAQEDDGWGRLLKENFDISWLPETEKHSADEVIRLLDSSNKKLFLAQSGLMGSNSTAPNHHALLTASENTYTLSDTEDTLKVPLTWTDDNGIEVTKTFIFTRGSFVISLEQEIINNSNKTWQGRQYSQLLRKPLEEDGNNKNFIRTYEGPVLYSTEEKYEKIDYDDLNTSDLSRKNTGGWSAMIQHYFATAWVPPATEENHFYTKKLEDLRYVIGSYSELVTVESLEQTTLVSKLFVGPKLQPVMEQVSEGLELTVDYGFLTFLGKPIFWLLIHIQEYVVNWGLAILGVTLCIKAVFFRLSKSSYTSMARMRKVQPKLTQLKESCGDDKQRFNTEMMALYKREKVNPLGGCFPILIQIPVFISLYWVLIETVEIRQAPFAGWLIDLSVQDPYYLLPVLMGITMKLQQLLNAPPIDPIQAKIMKMFPYIFTVFFLFFPSGLVLYWVCNNTLSFLQQWYITRQLEKNDPDYVA
ncbi:MAG: membrane protein insertase YidC [Methylococcaceae bacterium]|nr:membrane protein insertase YidC [Methylococcaceae bacterium]